MIPPAVLMMFEPREEPTIATVVTTLNQVLSKLIV